MSAYKLHEQKVLQRIYTDRIEVYTFDQFNGEHKPRWSKDGPKMASFSIVTAFWPTDFDSKKIGLKQASKKSTCKYHEMSCQIWY